MNTLDEQITRVLYTVTFSLTNTKSLDDLVPGSTQRRRDVKGQGSTLQIFRTLLTFSIIQL
jgi:hypothetical protein